MQFRIEFEVASLFLLTIIMIYLIAKTKYKDTKYKIFLGYFILLSIDVIIDILTVIGYKYYDTIPVWINYILNVMYLSLQFILPTLYAANLYVLNKSPVDRKNRMLYYIIPTFVFLIILWCFNAPFKLIFYFEDGVYCHGPLHFLLYLNVIYYVIITIINIIIKSVKKEAINTWVIIMAMIVSTILMLSQLVFTNELTAGYGVSLSLLIVFLSFKTPYKNVDIVTNALNQQSFIESCDRMIKSKKKIQEKIVIFYFSDYDNFLANNGLEKFSFELIDFVKYSCNIIGADHVYRLDNKSFAFVYNTDKEIGAIRGKISELFGMESFTYFYVLCEDIQDFQSGDEFIMVLNDKLSASTKSFVTVPLDKKCITEVYRKNKIENRLKKILSERKIEIHFQPIYNTKQNQATGIEALARMNIPGLGYVSPGEFIEIAEKKNYIGDLGLIIYENVLEALKKFKFDEFGVKFIDVNISPKQFEDETICEKIDAISKLYDVKKDMIRFEVTESSNMMKQEKLLKTIYKLIGSGYQFSLDDFGIGYSTIECISKIPFRCIKFDKSLIDSSRKNEQNKIIFENLVFMFRKMNKKMIIEGVEDEATAKYVKDTGITYIQGYYYSNPLKPEDLVKYLEKTNK